MEIQTSTAKNKVAIVGIHGIGDCLHAAACADVVANKIGRNNVDLFFAVRDEVFAPLWRMLGNKFNVQQVPVKEAWGNNYFIVKNLDELLYWGFDHYGHVFVVCPDMLYQSVLGFDYNKYQTNPELLLQHRVLTRDNVEKRIFVSLASSTPGYLYADVGVLLRRLGANHSDYEIYFPKVDKWSGVDINYGPLGNMPNNVNIVENPDMLTSIEKLSTSAYAVTTDNGFYHIAHHYGVPLTLLDPQYSKYPWVVRWRHNLKDCVSIHVVPDLIAKVVKANINYPLTLTLDRKWIIDAQFQENSWNMLLGVKIL